MAKQTRRQFLKTSAIGAAALSLPSFWRTTDAQTKLSLAIYSHWVPGANETSKRLIDEWGKKNKVETKVEYIGNVKDQLTKAAASRAGVGPDIM